MSLVGVTSNGPFASVMLDRPEARNALSVELCDAIVEALDDVGRMESSRVVLLAGAGPVFCAGADLAALSGPQGVDFLPAFERMLEALARHPLPTIARVQGAALGGGLQLATVCDFRICASDALLGIPSSRLGIVVNLENVERLVDLVGSARAKEVLMTGRSFTGAEAVGFGLATRSCDREALEKSAAEFAADVAALAPMSVQGAKRTIGALFDERALRGRNPTSALEIDALVAEAYASDDLAEGVAAMGEKRPPRFKGS